MTAVEYYANLTEDDIENGVVGGLIVKENQNPNDIEIEETIVGETFIKPKKTYEYIFEGTAYQDWIVDKKYPVTITKDEYNPRHIWLKWNSSYCGQFELTYGLYTKTIVVESLF